MSNFEKELKEYFEGRQAKNPEFSHKPMLYHFWTKGQEEIQSKLDKAVEALEGSCKYDESWEVEDCDNSEPEKQRYLMFKKLIKEIKEGE